MGNKEKIKEIINSIGQLSADYQYKEITNENIYILIDSLKYYEAQLKRNINKIEKKGN